MKCIDVANWPSRSNQDKSIVSLLYLVTSGLSSSPVDLVIMAVDDDQSMFLRKQAWYESVTSWCSRNIAPVLCLCPPEEVRWIGILYWFVTEFYADIFEVKLLKRSVALHFYAYSLVLKQGWGTGKALLATLMLNVFSGPHLHLMVKFHFKKAQYFVPNLTTFVLRCFLP